MIICDILIIRRQRGFKFLQLFAFAVICEYYIHLTLSTITHTSCTVGNTAPWALMSIVFSLTNGGTAGAIWMFAIVAFCMFFVVLVSGSMEDHTYVQLTDRQSFAEAASIAPTAGGQYRTCVHCPTNELRRLTECRLGVRVCAAKVRLPTSHLGEHALTASHRRHQKFMSYLTGWYAVLGWQTSLVGTALAPAQIFQAVIILYNPSFASKGMFTTGRNAF